MLAMSLSFAWWAGGPNSRESATGRVGTAVARLTDPDDRILVWGIETNTYLPLAGGQQVASLTICR